MTSCCACCAPPAAPACASRWPRRSTPSTPPRSRATPTARMLKDSLSLTLAKTVEEKQLFERTFDLYFSRDAVSSTAEAAPTACRGQSDPARNSTARPGFGGSPGEGGGGGSAGAGRLVAQMMQENDQAALTAAMERAGEAVGVSNISLSTQDQSLRAAHPGADGDARARTRNRAGEADRGLRALLDRLEQRAGAELIEQARAFVERQLGTVRRRLHPRAARAHPARRTPLRARPA